MTDSFLARQTPVTRIGVTGLSQAGKSTLITSLINHLENLRRGSLAARAELGLMVHGHWLRGGERAFDYDAGLHALTNQPPHWPASTTDWSIARIEITMARPWYSLKPTKRIIELFDYPGEWLLDLMLIDWSYSDFCRALWAWSALDPRRTLGSELIAALTAIDPYSPVDMDTLNELQARWADFLGTCRIAPHQLSQNLPGRFLIHGRDFDGGDHPFVPLFAQTVTEGGGGEGRFPEGSWGAVCQANFNHYRLHQAKPFFDRHFRDLDAQVILIDLLGAMSAGPDALKDMRAALEGVLRPFRYQRGNWLAQLFRKRIRRVAVCATKIDHLLPEDQKRLQSLMESYLYETVQRLAAESIELKVMAVAAVQSAQLVESGNTASLIGRDKRSGEKIRFTPPTLPNTMPHNLNLKIDELPQLAPPGGLDRVQVFPSRRIDQLLAFLLKE